MMKTAVQSSNTFMKQKEGSMKASILSMVIVAVFATIGCHTSTNDGKESKAMELNRLSSISADEPQVSDPGLVAGDTNGASTEDTEAWKTLVEPGAVDALMGNTAIASTWPALTSEPSYEDGQVPSPKSPACYYGRFSRIAVVTIDAIVRDYGNELLGDVQWTVYRLRVKETLMGDALPDTLYGAAITGAIKHLPGDMLKHGYPSSNRKVGDTGIALLDTLGYDPIRAQAQLRSDSYDPLSIIPARVMNFAIFLPAVGDGVFDSSAENRHLGELTESEVVYVDLIRDIGLIDDLCTDSCKESRKCGTSEIFLGKGFDPSCACINDWTGCADLAVESPTISGLYQP